jgi:hypothetical protein
LGHLSVGWSDDLRGFVVIASSHHSGEVALLSQLGLGPER